MGTLSERGTLVERRKRYPQAFQHAAAERIKQEEIDKRHESRDFYGLVPHRRPSRQYRKAPSAKPRRRSSHRGCISRCDWRFRSDGPYRLVRRRHRLSVGYKLFIAWLAPAVLGES